MKEHRVWQSLRESLKALEENGAKRSEIEETTGDYYELRDLEDQQVNILLEIADTAAAVLHSYDELMKGMSK